MALSIWFYGSYHQTGKLASLMDSCEPPKKRARMSRVSTRNTKVNNSRSKSDDRVLEVEKKEFYVNSELLAAKSEYFRVLFNSDFKEKDQKVIELKNISARSFELFLMAVNEPTKLKPTKGKLVDLIKTISYFGANNLLKDIFAVKENFNKIPKDELLRLAKNYEIQELKEIVEDWYLDRCLKSRVEIQYKQYEKAVQYDLKRLMTCFEDWFMDAYDYEFSDFLWQILQNNTELGKKMLERMKARVLVACNVEHKVSAEHSLRLLFTLTSHMNEEQFESIKDSVEALLLSIYGEEENIGHNMGYYIPIRLFQTLPKLMNFVTDKLIEEFPGEYNKFELMHIGIDYNLQRFLTYVNDYFIADFPQNANLQHIDFALLMDGNVMDRFKDFLKVYLRNNSATLSAEIKNRIVTCEWNNVKLFVLECILSNPF